MKVPDRQRTVLLLEFIILPWHLLSIASEATTKIILSGIIVLYHDQLTDATVNHVIRTHNTALQHYIIAKQNSTILLHTFGNPG